MRHALLIAFTSIALFAGTTSARPSGVMQIDNVQIGFPTFGAASAFRVGSWAPVRVDLTNGAERIAANEAVVVVDTNDSDDVHNLYTVPLPALEPSEQRAVFTYVRLGTQSGDLTISVKANDGRVLAVSKQNMQTHDALPAEHILYLTLGARPSGMKAALTKSTKQKVEQLNPNDAEPASDVLRTFSFMEGVQELPTNWFGYDGIDVLFLSSGKEAFIKELLEAPKKQKEALAEWVRRGGRLVVSAGRNQQYVQKLLAELQLIPCGITGTIQRQRLGSVHLWIGGNVEPFAVKQGTIDVAKLEPGPGCEVMLPQAGNQRNPSNDPPLIVQAPCGLGRVLLVAFDLDQQPFVGWNGGELFWLALKGQLEPRLPIENNQLGRMGFSNGKQELGTQLKNRLDTFDEVPVISTTGRYSKLVFVRIELGDAFEFAYFAQHRGGELSAAEGEAYG